MRLLSEQLHWNVPEQLSESKTFSIGWLTMWIWGQRCQDAAWICYYGSETTHLQLICDSIGYKSTAASLTPKRVRVHTHKDPALVRKTRKIQLEMMVDRPKTGLENGKMCWQVGRKSTTNVIDAIQIPQKMTMKSHKQSNLLWSWTTNHPPGDVHASRTF